MVEASLYHNGKYLYILSDVRTKWKRTSFAIYDTEAEAIEAGSAAFPDWIQDQLQENGKVKASHDRA